MRDEKTVSEIIDQYLLGKILPDDLSRLEMLRRTQPDIETRIQQDLEVMKVIRYLRYQQLREKLKNIDHAMEHSGKGFFQRKYIIRFLLLLTGCITLWICACIYFKPSFIAHRNFVALTSSDREISMMNENELELWNTAQECFMNREYRCASNVFLSLSGNTESELTTAAKWNYLLSALAAEGASEEWKTALQQYVSNASGLYKSKAQALSRLMDSRLFHFFIYDYSSGISVLKPRLM